MLRSPVLELGLQTLWGGCLAYRWALEDGELGCNLSRPVRLALQKQGDGLVLAVGWTGP